MSSMYFLYYLPLETGIAFDFNKLESSSRKYALTILIKTWPMHLEKKIFKALFKVYFSHYYLPLKKDMALHLCYIWLKKSTLWKLL